MSAAVPGREAGAAPRKGRVSVCGVPIDDLPDAEAAIAELESRIARGAGEGPARVSFVNAHVVNTALSDPELMAVLRESELSLADGIGVWLGGRILAGADLANLNGTDLGLELLRWGAARGMRFYFLGAKDGIADIAKERLAERIPGLLVVGVHDGYLDAAASEEVVREIREARADLLFVCMGVPAQEKWISRHRSELPGVKAAFGLGAFFDFYAGVVPRAPAWMIKARLEWVYRLRNEPRRLWRRYLVGNFAFMAHVVRFKAKALVDRTRSHTGHAGGAREDGRA